MGNARIRGKKNGRREGEMRLCNWFRMYKYVAEYRTTKRRGCGEEGTRDEGLGMEKMAGEKKR